MESSSYRDLDNIYEYIAEALMEPGNSSKLINSLQDAIFSLENIPYRGVLIKTSPYANKGYRQIFVGNFTVVCRIAEAKKMVLAVIVRYSKSQF